LLGRVAYRVLFLIAERLIDAHVGVVLESNFVRGSSELELRPLVAKSRSVLVQCDVPEELAQARYRARAQIGGRHAVHKDDAVLEAWGAGIRSDHSVLELGIPVIHVDTSDGYRPAIATVVAQLRSFSR
jgi:predicted kinase